MIKSYSARLAELPVTKIHTEVIAVQLLGTISNVQASDSNEHADEQPSQLLIFPSSHASKLAPVPFVVLSPHHQTFNVVKQLATILPESVLVKVATHVYISPLLYV
ncbi:MAG: hypothetical protein Q8O99_04920 [bacterium]|nr:hypothetical protein [bacterium]